MENVPEGNETLTSPLPPDRSQLARGLASSERRKVPFDVISRAKQIVLETSLLFSLGSSVSHPAERTYLPMFSRLLSGDDRKTAQMAGDVREAADTFVDTSAIPIYSPPVPPVVDTKSAPVAEKTPVVEHGPSHEQMKILDTNTRLVNQGPCVLEVTDGKIGEATLIQDFASVDKQTRGLVNRTNLRHYGDITKADYHVFQRIDPKYLVNSTIYAYRDGLIIFDKQSGTYSAFLLPRSDRENRSDLRPIYTDVSPERIATILTFFGGDGPTDRNYFIGMIVEAGLTDEEVAKVNDFAFHYQKDEKTTDALKQQIAKAFGQKLMELAIQSGTNVDFIMDTFTSLREIIPDWYMTSYGVDIVRTWFSSTDTGQNQERIKERVAELVRLNREMPGVFDDGRNIKDLISVINSSSTPQKTEEDLVHLYSILPKGNSRENIGYYVAVLSQKGYSIGDITEIASQMASSPIADILTFLSDYQLENFSPDMIKKMLASYQTDYPYLAAWYFPHMGSRRVTSEWGVYSGYDLSCFIFSYYAGQVKSGRSIVELNKDEMKNLLSFGPVVSNELMNYTSYFGIPLEGVVTEDDLMVKISDAYSRRNFFEDDGKSFSDASREASKSLAYLINKVHDYEMATKKTDNFRHKLIDTLTPEATINLLALGTFREGGDMGDMPSVLYTSSFELIDDHARVQSENDRLSLLKSNTERLRFYTLGLGRYGRLHEETLEHPDVFYEPMVNLLSDSIIPLTGRLYLTEGVRGGLESNLSDKYQQFLYSLYNDPATDSNMKAFTSYLMNSNVPIFQKGAYASWINEEMKKWPEVAKPVLPDFDGKNGLTSIFYYNRNDYYDGTKAIDHGGVPEAIDFFTKSGYTVRKIDSSNWLMRKIATGKYATVQVLVTFGDQKEGLKVFKETTGIDSPNATAFLQHSPELDKFMTGPVFDDSKVVTLLGSCGSAGSLNSLYGKGYRPEFVANWAVGYPEVNLVLLDDLLHYWSGGGKSWDSFQKEVQMTKDTYQVVFPTDPGQQVLGYIGKFSGE